MDETEGMHIWLLADYFYLQSYRKKQHNIGIFNKL